MMRRRQILGAALSGGGLLALGRLAGLPPLSAVEARLDPLLLQADSGIAPLVRLILETPRDRLIEEFASRVKKGLAYKDALAALMRAGVQSVQPRPSVGFKFHAVLVINSCHVASLSSADGDRWLPIFWALDHFKGSQAEEQKKTGWTMKPVEESAVPPPHKARKALAEALDAWDEAAADAAAAGLARGNAAHEAFELLVRYGARDFRSIGHKAIYMANGWRTLQCIGMAHAEPIFRSLAHAFTAREGQDPTKGDLPADRPWRRNQELARTLREEWRGGKIDPGATADLLASLRQASDEEAPRKVVEMLNAGISPQSAWDGLFAAAGELMMRRPDIRSLHAVTTLNALRHGFETTGSDETRRLLLLQAAAFVPLFRGNAPGNMKDLRIDALEPEACGSAAEVFAELPKDRMAGARKALGFLKAGGKAGELIEAARNLVFLKGQDAHDYKFSSAALEDSSNLSPGWSDRFLASGLFYFKGAGSADNGIVERIRTALKA